MMTIEIVDLNLSVPSQRVQTEALPPVGTIIHDKNGSWVIVKYTAEVDDNYFHETPQLAIRMHVRRSD